MQIGKASAPRDALADVPAHMAEQRPQARGVAVGVARRESAAARKLGAELDQEIGRGDPLGLHAVVIEPTAEERLVGKRGVLEVPGVLVDLIQIADAREEAPALDGESLS